MELVSDEGRLCREHPVDCVEQLPHDGDVGLDGFLPRATSLSKKALSWGSWRTATSAGMKSARRMWALPTFEMRAGLSTDVPDWQAQGSRPAWATHRRTGMSAGRTTRLSRP